MCIPSTHCSISIFVTSGWLNLYTGQTDFTGRTCKLPQRVHRGLPAGGRCVQIACGSVHTILLMDCVC